MQRETMPILLCRILRQAATVNMLTVSITILMVTKVLLCSVKTASFSDMIKYRFISFSKGIMIMVNIDDEGRKGQIKDWLRKSHSTANYLLSLVNDILDMSKLQAGRVDLVREPLLVSTMIDERLCLPQMLEEIAVFIPISFLTDIDDIIPVHVNQRTVSPALTVFDIAVDDHFVLNGRDIAHTDHGKHPPLNGLIGMNHLIMVNIDDEGRKGQIKDWLRKSHSTAAVDREHMLFVCPFLGD